jgi:hypothetical protein
VWSETWLSHPSTVRVLALRLARGLLRRLAAAFFSLACHPSGRTPRVRLIRPLRKFLGSGANGGLLGTRAYLLTFPYLLLLTDFVVLLIYKTTSLVLTYLLAFLLTD